MYEAVLIALRELLEAAPAIAWSVELRADSDALEKRAAPLIETIDEILEDLQ